MTEKTFGKTLWEWMLICATASIGLGLGAGIMWVASVEGNTWAWWQMILGTVLAVTGFGFIAPLGFITSIIFAASATPYGQVSNPKQ